jgi:hypothetical protein
MISFGKWISIRESSPHTRARAAAARGLLPPQTVGSIHGKSTASPWETEQLTKLFSKHRRKKKSKFGASPSKKKITTTNHNLEIDRWMKEVGDLRGDLEKLKAVFDAKKKNLKDIEKKTLGLKSDDQGEKGKQEPDKKGKQEPDKKGKQESDKPDKKDSKQNKKGQEEESEN